MTMRRTTTFASWFQVRVLPGLNPNHPSQRRRMAMVIQPGLTLMVARGLSERPFFFSSIQIRATMASPAAAAAPWTTRPPAKSLIPR
jgi:hypothetical protein